MANNIKHLGIVENIDGSHVRVKIVQSSACSACSVKGHCTISESKEKTIDVFNVRNVPCRIGEQVLVVGTTSMGLKAVLLAFVLPAIVLFFALTISLHITGKDEIRSVLIALCSLVPYYFIIYKYKNKLGRSLLFTLEPV